MILVDSSVWVDYFRGIESPQTHTLDRLLGKESLVIGDLILTEVLQGFVDDRTFREAKRLLASLDVVELGSYKIAVQAAENFRALRRLGIIVTKTIDCIIATHCIESRHELLHNDRDFIPFENHLGLRVIR